MKKLTLNQIIGLYLLEVEGRRLSEHTIMDYRVAFNRLVDYFDGNKTFAEIDVPAMREFFAHLSASEFGVPNAAIPREPIKLSKKTLLNHHTAYSALWTWAVKNDEAAEHIMRRIPRPKPEQTDIVPLSQRDFDAMVAACSGSRDYTHYRSGATTSNTRPTELRDKAILYLLIDTGIRASELCDLRIRDLDSKNRQITVTGKGDKTRTIPLSDQTWRTMMKYILTARDNAPGDSPAFLSKQGTSLTRNALYQLIDTLGTLAGVTDAHPHRFRHSFAVMFLRNGGNIYALRKILGHTTLHMVETYLTIAEADIEHAHALASPVANMRRK
jgi:integrase/recombinase XerD